MQRTLICVARNNGRWRVTESGPRNSIAWFGERQNAMDLAAELAASTQGSILQISLPEEDPRSIGEAAYTDPETKKARLGGIRRRYRTDRSGFRAR